MDRRSFNKVLAATVATAAAGNPAWAQSAFPSKVLRIVVPYAPGGTTDTLARAIAHGLAGQTSHPVIVENKPGAAGSIGASTVARAPADGHTLLITTGSTATLLPYTMRLAFDPLAVLAPVSEVGRTPLFLYANASIPAKDLGGLITWMKANPGKIAYGSYGPGTQGHFGGLILSREAGVEMIHVPFQGGAPALQALIGGHVQLTIDAYQPAMEQVKAGRALALATSDPERSPYAPTVPTFRELGFPAVERISGFFGMFAPAGTDAGIVARLNAMVMKVADSKEFQDQLPKLGVLPPSRMSPAEMDQSIRRDNAAWASFVKEVGFQPGG